MPGFMKGPLGFASTTGAFIKGAAQGGSELLAEERAQARQDDLMQQQVWANKADNNNKLWREQKNQLDNDNGLYNNFLDRSGGDKRIADHLMNLYNSKLLDPKDQHQITETVNGLKAAGIAGGSDYQSTTQQNLARRAQEGYGATQDYTSRLNPKYQNWISPATPWDNPNNRSSGMSGNPSGASSAPSMPNSAPMTSPASSSAPQSATASPSAAPRAAPDTTGEPTPIAPSVTGATPPMPPIAAPPEPGTNAPDNPSNIPQIGGNKALLGKEPLKPSDFNTPQGYVRYDASMRKDAAHPDLSDLKQVTTKLDPAVHAAIAPQIAEISKNSALMTPANRAEWNKSVQEAYKTGDTSKVRWDLAPSQIEIDQAKNRQIAGAEAGKKYNDDLMKRSGNVWVNNSMIQDADRILQMISDPKQPLQAGAFQPIVDEVNRYLTSAGLPAITGANPIEKVNMLKKVLGDMTFDQISQYHLGRWTNYEVSILKQKLPDIGSDPSSMVKIALLFKNAAERENRSLIQEKKIAYGEKGENLYTPNSGAANMYRDNLVHSEEGKLPWIQINSHDHPTPEDRAAVAKLPSGTWYESKQGEKMYRVP